VDAAALAATHAGVDAEITRAIEQARRAPQPTVADLTTDVFA